MYSRETEWFEEIQKGNLKAFDELFKHFYSSLCIYATDILKNHGIAEEIVQDVFLKLWNNRSTIIIRTSLQAYLYKMVHNQSLNYIRDYEMNKNENISIDDINHRIDLLGLKSSSDTLSELINHQMEKEIEDAVNNLPLQCREIFLLARYQNYSYSEVASRLSISVSTVKTQMLRAVDKLKSTLIKE